MEKSIKMLYEQIVQDVTREVLKNINSDGPRHGHYENQVLDALVKYGVNGVKKTDFEKDSSVPSVKVLNRTLETLVKENRIQIALLKTGKKGRPVKFIRAIDK